MFGLFDEDNEDLNTANLDVLWTIIGVLLILVVMKLFAIVMEEKPIEKDGSINQNNVLLIEARWPDKMCDDIDLWVLAPGEGKPVGFSNRGGVVMDLLRDDLGCSNDATTLNMELQFSRGVPAGEYVINIQGYRVDSEKVPVAVTVTLRPINGATRQLLTRQIVIEEDDEEQTVFSFTLDGNGNLTKRESTLFRPLFQERNQQ